MNMDRPRKSGSATPKYRLTTLCTFEDRFVIPPAHREEAIEMMKDPHEHKAGAGFGFLTGPKRGL